MGRRRHSDGAESPNRSYKVTAESAATGERAVTEQTVTDIGEGGREQTHNTGQGKRRSTRSHAVADAERSAGAEQGRQVAKARKRARAQECGDRAAQRAQRRVKGREEVASRIAELARKEGRALEERMRGVESVAKLKEKWRWSFTPTGAQEQLVLFDHGERGSREDKEVRAVILVSEYGRGLYYASEAAQGMALGYYDGEEVTDQEFGELDECTGLRHTLEVGGKMINGIHGVTGMQYANTSRRGDEANNASFSGTTSVVSITAGRVTRGQPVLIPYKWTPATWEEIDSKVIGVCAYEERGQNQGLGEEGGTYIKELASAIRAGGLAAQML